MWIALVRTDSVHYGHGESAHLSLAANKRKLHHENQASGLRWCFEGRCSPSKGS